MENTTHLKNVNITITHNNSGGRIGINSINHGLTSSKDRGDYCGREIEDHKSSTSTARNKKQYPVLKPLVKNRLDIQVGIVTSSKNFKEDIDISVYYKYLLYLIAEPDFNLASKIAEFIQLSICEKIYSNHAMSYSCKFDVNITEEIDNQISSYRKEDTDEIISKKRSSCVSNVKSLLQMIKLNNWLNKFYESAKLNKDSFIAQMSEVKESNAENDYDDNYIELVKEFSEILFGYVCIGNNGLYFNRLNGILLQLQNSIVFRLFGIDYGLDCQNRCRKGMPRQFLMKGFYMNALNYLTDKFFEKKDSIEIVVKMANYFIVNSGFFKADSTIAEKLIKYYVANSMDKECEAFLDAIQNKSFLMKLNTVYLTAEEEKSQSY